MSGALERLGTWSAIHPLRVLAGWLAILAAAVLIQVGVGASFFNAVSVPGSGSDQGLELLAEEFPQFSGDNASLVIAVEPRNALADVRDIAGMVTKATSAIQQLDDVSLVSPPRIDIPGHPQVSADGRIAFFQVQYTVAAADVGTEGIDGLHEAAEFLEDAGLTVAVGGPVATASEEPETGAAEAIGIVAALLILILAFGSLVAAGLPVLTALVGIVIGMSGVALVSQLLDTATFAPQIATMVGIAVGIDYALFVVTRHRENLNRGMGLADSIAVANATAGQAVVFAGGTVVIAILGLWLTGVPFMGSIGTAVAVLVAGAVLLAITLLPALLGLLGNRVNRLAIPGLDPSRSAEGSHFWVSWSRHISDRPWPYLIGAIAVLGLMSVPALDMELAYPDASNNPDGSDSRVAYDLLAEGFGPGFNGPIIVAAALDNPLVPIGPGPAVGSTDQATQPPSGPTPVPPPLAPLHAALTSTDAIAQVQGPIINQGGDTAVLVVIPASAPQAEETRALVDDLRSEILPSVADEVGAEIYVTGFTAVTVDLDERLADVLVWFIGGVVALSFLLLMVVFRSVLVPLKAAVMNVFSITAAYGAVVAVFQWGWGLDLVGLDTALPIPSFLPVPMFAILFGLSMDYEVFLLSRVREDYLRTGDNHHSVATGLAHTARVITSAAAIMIAVFAAFISSDDVTLKLVGTGMAIAVLVDATIIRLVLVPSTMALLGDANWWLPRWLDRLLPHIDLEGTKRGGLAHNDEPDASHSPALEPPDHDRTAAGPARQPKQTRGHTEDDRRTADDSRE